MKYCSILLFLLIVTKGYSQSNRDSLLLHKILYGNGTIADTSKIDKRILGVLKSIDRNIFNFVDTSAYYYPRSKKVVFFFHQIRIDTLVSDRALLLKRLFDNPYCRDRLKDFFGNDTSKFLSSSIAKGMGGLYYPDNQIGVAKDFFSINFNNYNSLLKNIIFYSDSFDIRLRKTLKELNQDDQIKLLDYIKHEMNRFSKTKQEFYSSDVSINNVTFSNSGLIYADVDACPTGFMLTFDMNQDYKMIKSEGLTHITDCWSPVEEDLIWKNKK